MSIVLELVAERPVAGGFTLARAAGKVVLVSGAIPGERVRVRVERDAKNVTFATVDDVIEPSPFRRPAVSDPGCGGLTYAHVDYNHQLQLKAQVIADALHRLGHIPIADPVHVVASPESGYRLRARLHVRGRRVGFFREGTHHLCDAGPSRQLLPASLAAAEALVATIGADADRCDAITISENVAATERVAHLTLLDRAALSVSHIEPPPGITGVTVEQRGMFHTLGGRPFVRDNVVDLCGPDVELPPSVAWQRHGASFFQGNRYVTGPMLRYVLGEAEGARVLDLYAGVGLFGVALAARGASVLAVEGDSASGADLRANAEPWSERLEIALSSVEEVLRAVAPDVADVVVLDPPRTGMSSQALAGMLALGAPRIVYVSCDPATLARDARAILTDGYRLGTIQAFDMFPNTAHVETVCTFLRKI